MDISVKNVDKRDWGYIRTEAVKNKVRTGKFIGILVSKYVETSEKKSNWKKILETRPFLSDKEAEEMKKSVVEFRKGFNFR